MTSIDTDTGTRKSGTATDKVRELRRQLGSQAAQRAPGARE